MYVNVVMLVIENYVGFVESCEVVEIYDGGVCLVLVLW